MDESLKEIIRNVIDQMVPAHKLLGVTLHEVEPGKAVLKLPFRQELVGDPRHNRLHGGIVAAVMDSAGGTAAITTLTGPDDMVSSVDFRVDFLEPGRPEDLLVEASILRSGTNILVTNMRAWHPDSDTVICEGRGVYRVRRLNAQQPRKGEEVQIP